MKHAHVTAMAAVLLGLTALCSTAAARTTFEVKDGKMVVTVYIAYKGGNDALIDRWNKEILDTWNGPDGSGQTYGECGHKVVFALQSVKVPADKPFPKGYHRIEIQPYDGHEASLPHTPDGRVAIAYMGKTTHSPSRSGATIDGVWSTQSSALVNPRKRNGERFKDAAHEVGHMMGLPDYYDHKLKFYGRNLMGSTNGPYARVTPQLVQGVVEALSGKYYCPMCPAPSDRPPLEPIQFSGLVQGLEYSYYEGKFGMIPDFGKLVPKKTGHTAGLALDMADGGNFAVKFTGFLEVPADGVYTFFLRSDDGSRLTVGSKLIADNDGEHGMWSKRGEIKLKAGKHPIQIDYFNAGNHSGLELRYSGPNSGKQIVPATALYSLPAGTQLATPQTASKTELRAQAQPKVVKAEGTSSRAGSPESDGQPATPSNEKVPGSVN